LSNHLKKITRGDTRETSSSSKAPLLARAAVLALGVALIILGATAIGQPESYTPLTPLLSDPRAAAYKFGVAAFSLGLWCLLVSLVTPYLTGRRLSFNARLTGFRSWGVVLFLVFVYIVAYSVFTINRHNQFNSHCFDLAIMDQVVWNTAQGRLFASSIEVTHRFADHVQPLLALWAPLYWIYPRVEVLLVVQTVGLALGAFPVYWLARHYLQDDLAGWTFAGLYLAYPALGFVNRFDFHNEFVVVPLLLLCFLAIARRNTWLLSLTLALILFGKEEMGLTVGFVGLYLVFFVKEYRKLGAFWAVAGVVYSFIALFVIIPYFRQGQPSDTLVRYGWLGQTPPQMIGALLTRPLYVIKGVPLLLLLWYLFQMTMPLAFTPFFSPQTLLLGLPALAYNFLSANSAQHDIYLHYTAIQIPVFFISAIVGTRRLVERGLVERIVSFMFPQSKGKIAPLPLILLPMVGLTLVSFITNNPFTEQLIEPFNLVELDNVQAAHRAIALVPPDSSVLAASAYVPHLSHRLVVSMYPSAGISDVQSDYFLFNLHDGRYVHIRPPDWHLEQLTWAANHGYGIVFAEKGVYLLKKGGGTPLDEQTLYEMRQEAKTWGLLWP
jgi:uncharacterized membrane protein